jgi:3-isopropylmalate dehydrogenase
VKLEVLVLPGDGVGPEVVAEGLRSLVAVCAAFGHELAVTEEQIGVAAFEREGTALPEHTLEQARRSAAVLLGAVGQPRWERPGLSPRPELGYGVIRLRKELGLFANLRPVRLLPELTAATTLKPSVVEGTDLVIVRELTGGIYFAEPKRVWRGARGREAVDTLAYSECEVERILRVGFELARRRRRRLTSVDKFQILRSSELWREVAVELSAQYSDVRLEHMLVDACAMQLIQHPTSFDVIVTENLFGDILSDEASVLAGSLGMMPSASLAGIPAEGVPLFGLYEPIHGSAPGLAGRDVANPIATILAVALMLRFSFGLEAEARRVEESVAQALAAGLRTEDIATPGATTVGTREIGEAIARRCACISDGC